jgi:PKD repeat protein
MTALISRMATAAGVLALASACTMKNQDAPPLTGPSELSQSIGITVSPDVLPQDGASQSFVTITARDANAQPIRNLTLRTETRVGGTPVDFGTLSARSVVTGSDGKATLVYTAPPSPAISPDAFLVVDIVVTPFGTDFNNSSQRSAGIRLVPQGTVIPPGDLVPSFTFVPTGPTENQTVLFDASASTGTIVDYAWDFGDGDRGSGRTAEHAYRTAGTYVARLTISDSFGRTATASQSVTVGGGTAPTAAFSFSPTAPLPTATVFFNASASRPAPGRTLTGYRWDFGDGASGSGVQASHAYAVAGSYNVTLVVTDDVGRTATVSQPVTVGSVSGTIAFTFSPTNPFATQTVFFNASESRPAPGRTLVSYRWDFGDGAAGTGVQTSHPYVFPGSYTVTLTVTDDLGGTLVLSHTVTVASDNPTATFTFAPPSPAPGAPVAFNGSGSSAVAGRTITAYLWNFGDGTTPTSGAVVSHSFLLAGTYNVTLIVTDSATPTPKSSSFTLPVTVAAATPIR